MPRPASQDSKRVMIGARVTSADAKRIDGLRGGKSRTAWVEALIARALAVTAEVSELGYSKARQTGRERGKR